MGRMLGAFDNPRELDRPDLNKCPDCECFFAQDVCPLCGKVCPDDMRAGHRKAPKKERRRRDKGGRVVFVEWYHSWLAIILFTIFIAPVGIILLLTSPHKTSHKVIFVVLAVVSYIILTILSIIGWSLLSLIMWDAWFEAAAILLLL